MADLSAMMLNQGLMESALSFQPTVQANALKSAAVSSADSASKPQNTESVAAEEGVYAVKGDSKYKEEMDTNTDGVITNTEMTQYYAKLASDYGSSLPSLENKSVGNVVTTAQAANAYMANEAAYSAGYTSLIQTSA